MNLVRMNQAIAIMNRSTRLLMTRYQTKLDHSVLVLVSDVATTEAELISKNNRACFAGYVAISPEFKADAGTMLFTGMPIFEAYRGAKAVAAWLDIETQHANNLVYGVATGRPATGLPYYYSPYYQKQIKDVVKANVISSLQALITNFPNTEFEG